MDKVVWWNRPIEGRGEKPTTPKPTLADVVTRQIVLPENVEIHSMGGRKPATDKPLPQSGSPVPVQPLERTKQ